MIQLPPPLIPSRSKCQIKGKKYTVHKNIIIIITHSITLRGWFNMLFNMLNFCLLMLLFKSYFKDCQVVLAGTLV